MITEFYLGMTVYSIFNVAQKYHLFMGTLVEIFPNLDNKMMVDWTYPMKLSNNCEDPNDLHTSPEDAKWAFLDQMNAEIEDEVQKLLHKFPDAKIIPEQPIHDCGLTVRGGTTFEGEKH